MSKIPTLWYALYTYTVPYNSEKNKSLRSEGNGDHHLHTIYTSQTSVTIALCIYIHVCMNGYRCMNTLLYTLHTTIIFYIIININIICI